jgi:WD40 repeat protein
VADLFISYAREDIEFVRVLDDRLRASGREAWVDWRGIPPSAEWLAEIRAAIDGAEVFVCVISPGFLASSVCQEELQHALARKKRIVPLLHREAPEGTIHPELAKLNWIFVRATDDLDTGVRTLQSAIDTDLDWVRAHTRLLVRAVEWDSKNREASYTLRARDLRAAEQWLAQAPGKEPQATVLHSEYILASRRATTRRERLVMAGVAFGVLVAAVLSVVAYFESHKAKQNQIDATANAAENALNVNLQIEALAAAVSAGEKLNEMNRPLERFLFTMFEDQSRNETYARVVSRLHQSLAAFHEKNRLEKHSDEVSAVAYSPDCSDGAQFLVSGGKDRRVIFWSAEQMTGDKSGTQASLSLDNGGPVTSVAISPDCQEIAAGGFENTIHIWRRAGGLAHTLNNADEIKTVQYSPDGHTLVLGDESGNIALWNRNGDKIPSIDAFNGVRIVGMKLRRCPNGEQLLLSASANLASPFKLWRLNHRLQSVSPSLPAPGLDAKAQVKSIGISADCSILAAGDVTGNMTLYRLDGALHKTWRAHEGPVRSIDFSRDGRFMVSGGETDQSQTKLNNGNSVKLWTLTGEPLATFEGHRGAVTEVTFSNDSRTIVSASADKTIRIWNIDNLPVIEKRYWDSTALDAKVSPDGNSVLAVRTDNTIEIFNFQTRNKEVFPNEPKLDPYFGVNDDAVYLLDKANNALSLSGDTTNNLINGYRGKADGVKFNPDGRSIALINKDGSVALWDLAGRNMEPLDGFKSTETATAFSPDGNILAAVSTDTKKPVIKLRTSIGAITGFPAEHQEEINQIVFASDGKMLATAGEDRLIKLWSLAGSELGTLIGHDSAVTNVAFHPEGKMLASSDFYGTVIVWSMSGRELARFNSDSKGNIWSLQFTRDGKWLVAAGMDSVTRWNLDLAELMQQGCRALNAYLSSNPNVSDQDKQLCRMH